MTKDRPPFLTLYQVGSAVGFFVLVAGSLAAVFGWGARFVAYWGTVLGPLCLVVAAFGLGTIVWTILDERNRAVKEFSEKERTP